MKKNFILPEAVRDLLKQAFEQKAQADQQAQQAAQTAAQAQAQQHECAGKIQGILSSVASFSGIDVNQGIELDPNLAFISGVEIVREPQPEISEETISDAQPMPETLSDPIPEQGTEAKRPNRKTVED